MDTQSNEGSPVAQPGNTQSNEVSLTHELDPLSLNLSPLSSPWTANEPLYLSDVGLPPLPLLPHGGELNPATIPHRENEAQRLASVAVSGSLSDLPAPSACPSRPSGAVRTIVKAHRTNDTRGRKAGTAQGEKKAQAARATAPPPQQEAVLTRHGYVDNPLPPAPASAAPLTGEKWGPPSLTLGAPARAPLHLTAPGPQQEQLRQQPIATPPMLQPGRSLSAHGSHQQCNMGSEQEATGALCVLISRRTSSQRNAALADILFEGALSQHAHALQYCQVVQRWRAQQYAEVAHDEQALQNAHSQQNAQNLVAAPTAPVVVTRSEPENTANANDAQLPRFPAPHVCSPSAAPLAPDLDQLIDFAQLAEPDADGVVSGPEFLPNWT